MMKEFDKYASGDVLRGEDLSEEEIQEWYREEATAYGRLGYIDAAANSKSYPYHWQNRFYGFSEVEPSGQWEVLGIGSAHGLEFEPIVDRVRRFTVIESDESYFSKSLFGRPAVYFRPEASGVIPVLEDSIDLVTCFGVLHHVAKPSRVLAEVGRCLKVGGVALVREPIISMGDWRYPRDGLTANERGIPLRVFDDLVAAAGLRIRKSYLINHSVSLAAQRLVERVPGVGFSIRAIHLLDRLLCAPYSAVRYHRSTFLQKLTPTSAFWVIEKP